MDIAIQLLQEIEIPFSQLLLVLQRDHLPVGFVSSVDGGLFARIGRVLLHFLVDVCHLVQRNQASAQIDRLYHHHRSCKEVTRVGIEGIDQILTQAIQLSRHVLQTLSGHLVKRIKIHAQCTQHCCDMLHGLRPGDAAKSCLKVAGRLGSQVAQCRLLVVAEQIHRPAGELIGSQSTHMRQVFCPCRLSDVHRHLLLHLRNADLLVVAQCHCTTAVECQQSLCTDRHHGSRKQY